MDNRKKNILLGVLIVGVISMTVAFAALSTTLSINGTAGIPTTRWDIHFANGTDNTSGTHANGKVNKGKIEDVNFQATSITGFTVTLYQPNDEVVYNFDIVNAGTIDAELDNFQRSITCASGSELCDEVMTYTIECEDEQHNNALAQGYILEKNKSVSCEMNVKFNDVDNLSKSKSSKVQASVVNGVYTQGALNATIRADWFWEQKSGSNSQNQGGNSGGSGSNTPSNPYLTTFDGNYVYGEWGIASLGEILSYNNEWNSTYLRQNVTTGVKETCNFFENGQEGTVCLTYNPNGYDISRVNDPYCENEDYDNCNLICEEGELIEEYPSDDGHYCVLIDDEYVTAKKTEMETKGATCQLASGGLFYESGLTLYCATSFEESGSNYCAISSSGTVMCGKIGSGGLGFTINGEEAGM